MGTSKMLALEMLEPRASELKNKSKKPFTLVNGFSINYLAFGVGFFRSLFFFPPAISY